MNKIKCGIEIHQQLNTNKLFCSCPSQINDLKERSIIRVLRASAGESGKIDQAALEEMKKEKVFEYQFSKENSCLVELDEEPPHEINKDALNLVLQVSKILKANIIKNIQIMRKTVVDGSNTSGFQRTGLVAINGKLETSKGNVGITNICIEEEAAQIVERTAEKDIYNLSRLGIPLIEIGTEPDIISGEHARETAEKIGMILRSTGKVLRGIGTIRQDLNVSIEGGERVEIKGAQDLRMIQKWVENEAIRQERLLEVRTELTKRGKFERNEIKNLTKLMQNSQSKVIRASLDNKGSVYGVKLSHFKGLTGREINPNRRVGSELSDYAKARAGVKGIFHYDELPNYGITQAEKDEIAKELNLGENDGFVIVAEKEEKAIIALEAVLFRAEKCYSGIIKEVRKPNPDGTTSYMRPMPGGERMYPETDVPLVILDPIELEEIKIPKLITERIEEFSKKYNISTDLVKQIVKEELEGVFEEYVKKYTKLEAKNIINVMIEIPKDIKARENIDYTPTDEQFDEILGKLNNSEIKKDAVYKIIIEMSKGLKIDYSKYKTMDNSDELNKEIIRIIKGKENLTDQALMGLVMAELKGKIDGKTAMEIIRSIKK